MTSFLNAPQLYPTIFQISSNNWHLNKTFFMIEPRAIRFHLELNLKGIYLQYQKIFILSPPFNRALFLVSVIKVLPINSVLLKSQVILSFRKNNRLGCFYKQSINFHQTFWSKINRFRTDLDASIHVFTWFTICVLKWSKYIFMVQRIEWNNSSCIHV